MRGRRRILVAVAVLVAGLAASPPAAHAADFHGQSAVFVSRTSSQVTIIAGSLRSDIQLQPTAQIIGGNFDPLPGDIGTSFLCNPGPGTDGMLSYHVVD